MSDHNTRPLAPDPTDAPAIQTWVLQIYGPDGRGGWAPTGAPAEWRAAHPYTAAARALVGDATRPPLALTSDQVLSISTGDTIWLTAADLVALADHLTALTGAPTTP